MLYNIYIYIYCIYVCIYIYLFIPLYLIGSQAFGADVSIIEFIIADLVKIAQLAELI